ncbi:MAG: RIO1 family regulatory kinase/ATPase [Desulfurococcaceae archaeon]
MANLGLVYKSLMDDDFKVLNAIERGLRRREYVPLEIIERYSGLHEEKITLILSKLHSLKLVKRKTISGKFAYRLTYTGYDMLAFKALVDANVFEAIGDKINVGKESEIYIGLAPGGVYLAVKIFRIGRTSFRKTARTRKWSIEGRHSWYEQSKIAAEREYKALRELAYLNAYVPVPIGYNRHVVVTEFIDGVELCKKPSLNNPEQVLTKVLETLAIAYHKASIVHGDLSEYNILVRRSDETPFIIDWPQYVYRDEPNAFELLKRDVYYITRFFRKTYGVDLDYNEAFKRVVEWERK